MDQIVEGPFEACKTRAAVAQQHQQDLQRLLQHLPTRALARSLGIERSASTGAPLGDSPAVIGAHRGGDTVFALINAGESHEVRRVTVTPFGFTAMPALVCGTE